MEIWQNGTGASVTVHAGAPDGPVVARFDDLEDSGPQKDETGRPDRYETYEARVVDAGGVNDLYVVTQWSAGERNPEVFVGEFSFRARGD